MKKQKLSVIYDGNEGEGVDMALDKAIEKAVKPFGYKRWASGYDLTTGERDIAFDRKEKGV